MFSRGLMESSKQGAAFGGEAVFLHAAVGFSGMVRSMRSEARAGGVKHQAFWKGAGVPYWQGGWHKRGFEPGPGRRNRGGRGRSEWLRDDCRSGHLGG